MPEHSFEIGVSHRPLLSTRAGNADRNQDIATCLALPRAISSLTVATQSFSLYRPGCVFDGPLRITNSGSKPLPLHSKCQVRSVRQVQPNCFAFAFKV